MPHSALKTSASPNLASALDSGRRRVEKGDLKQIMEGPAEALERHGERVCAPPFRQAIPVGQSAEEQDSSSPPGVPHVANETGRHPKIDVGWTSHTTGEARGYWCHDRRSGYTLVL